MLKIYLVSVIIYFIIFIATSKFAKEMIKNRKDIDYKEYIKNKEIKGKLSFTVVSFIPIMRLVTWGVMIFIIFARKEDLDKLFKESE